MTVLLQVFNDGLTPVPEVKLRVGRDYLRTCPLVKVFPAPTSEYELGSYRYFHFTSVPPGGPFEIRLMGKAAQPGQTWLHAELYTVDNVCHGVFKRLLEIQPEQRFSGDSPMPVDDKQMGLRVRKEIVRRQGIDTSRVEVTANRGVIVLRGEIRPVRGQDIDLDKELEIIEQAVRQIPGVRDIRNEIRTR